ncbi:MAG: hypothetical protein U0U69_16690 [Acidimicrobiia bacterium]
MKRKPNGNDWLVMGGALLWVVAFFLPWYHTTTPTLSQQIGGDVAGGLRWILFVLALAALALGVIVSFDLVEVHLGVSNGLLLMLAGALLSIGTLVYAVWPPTGSSFSYGVWLSLLGGLAITYGGFAAHNAEASNPHAATSRPDLRWTPQPPAPSTDAHDRDTTSVDTNPTASSHHRIPSRPPHTPVPTRSPETPTAPPSQPTTSETPKQPDHPGYGHGHGRGYGGGRGEGW